MLQRFRGREEDGIWILSSSNLALLHHAAVIVKQKRSRLAGSELFFRSANIFGSVVTNVHEPMVRKKSSTFHYLRTHQLAKLSEDVFDCLSSCTTLLVAYPSFLYLSDRGGCS